MTTEGMDWPWAIASWVFIFGFAIAYGLYQKRKYKDR
jgi:hypothetical protein